MKKPTIEELINCIIEQDEMRKLIKLQTATLAAFDLWNAQIEPVVKSTNPLRVMKHVGESGPRHLLLVVVVFRHHLPLPLSGHRVQGLNENTLVTGLVVTSEVSGQVRHCPHRSRRKQQRRSLEKFSATFDTKNDRSHSDLFTLYQRLWLYWLPPGANLVQV